MSCFVRRFYRLYFIEAYSISEWPFELIDREVVDSFLLKEVENFQSASGLLNYQQFRLEYVIGIVRSQNGHSPSLEMADNKVTEELTKPREKVENCLRSLDVPENMIAIHSKEIAFWNNIYAAKYSSAAILDKEDDTSQLENIQKLVFALKDLYSLSDFNYTSLISRLNYSLDFHSRYSKEHRGPFYILFPRRDFNLVPMYRNSFPLFCELAEKGFTKICVEQNVVPSEEIVTNLLYVLLSTWRNLTYDMFHFYGGQRVLVHSHVSINHAHSIASALENVGTKNLVFEIYDGYLIDEDRLAAYDFDVLVSTTTLSLAIKQPILCLHGTNQGPFYDPFLKLVDEIRGTYKDSQQEIIRQKVKKLDLDLFK